MVFWQSLRYVTEILDPNQKIYVKYQGVKEFHMLACIGCYCNNMVFSPFKVKVTYYDPLNQ